MIWHSTYFTWPEFWRGRQVVTVHDMIHERFPDLYHDRLDEIARQHKRRCVEQADAIICVSESTRMDLEYFYGTTSKPVYVVPSALSEVFRLLPPYMSRVQNWPDEPYLLYVGKRSHHKNFRGFMDAYRMWEGKTEVGVIVVGKPWEREEQAYLAQAGIAERVCLMSELDDEDLCWLYNRALAFVFPSLYEGLGLPVLEAMACGCPVVASQISTIVYTAGDVPFYFDPSQPQSLIAAIDQALVQGRHPSRVQRGISRAQQFTWDKTAKGYLEVYRELENR